VNLSGLLGFLFGRHHADGTASLSFIQDILYAIYYTRAASEPFRRPPEGQRSSMCDWSYTRYACNVYCPQGTTIHA
jgi:hypothetical protein